MRYCDIVKNHHWHLAAYALVNLYLHCKRLASAAQSKAVAGVYLDEQSFGLSQQAASRVQ